MPSPDDVLAAEKRKQEAEWGTYVALGPIDIGGTRAFNAGHAVPVSHVENGLVDRSQVKKVSASKSHHAAEKKDD